MNGVLGSVINLDDIVLVEKTTHQSIVFGGFTTILIYCSQIKYVIYVIYCIKTVTLQRGKNMAVCLVLYFSV